VVARQDFLEVEVTTVFGGMHVLDNEAKQSDDGDDEQEKPETNLSSLSSAEKTRSTSILSAEPATVAAPLFLSSSSSALNSAEHARTHARNTTRTVEDTQTAVAEEPVSYVYPYRPSRCVRGRPSQRGR
jgi:hypothetical protein